MQLLARGADPNPKDEEGNTPLRNASFWGQADVLTRLLSKSADPNAKNRAGQTPLDRAMRRGDNRIVDLLRKYGARE